MKNIILALACLASFSFKTIGDDKPACCKENCTKECIEMCKKNKCTDPNCCTACETKGCQGSKCKDDSNTKSCCKKDNGKTEHNKK